MLSLFPEILFLAPVAPLLIRVALALLMFYDGWHMFARADMRSRIAAFCAFAVGALLFVGAWTQLVAFLFVIAYLIYLFIPYGPRTSMPLSTMILAVVMALTLVFTGPGKFAFDLPL